MTILFSLDDPYNNGIRYLDDQIGSANTTSSCEI